MLSVSLSDHKRTKLPKMHLHIPLCCTFFFTIIYTLAQSRGIKSPDPTKVKVCPINLLFCAWWKFCQQRFGSDVASAAQPLE